MHFSDRETLLSLFLGLSFSEEGYPRHDVQRDVARALKRRSKEEIRSILGRITSGELERGRARLAAARRANIEIVTLVDELYPRSLAVLFDQPILLFFVGDLQKLDASRRIGIVGSRKATTVGRTTARTLGRALAGRNVVVVSGLAYGIDIESHRGVLESVNPRQALAVIPSGLDKVYPRGHFREAREIAAAGGLLISELPPGTRPLKHTFLERNRIIAALSETLIVVEARARSGALSTARQALELGQDIYCVPGGIERAEHYGTNQLLADGAGVLFDIEQFVGSKTEKPQMRKTSPQLEPLVRALESSSPLADESLSKELRLSLGETRALIQEAELSGVVSVNLDGSVRLAIA